MKRLADQGVLVVGASSGIGEAIARQCAQAGARVAVAARREDRLADLADALPGGAIAVPLDVCDAASCQSGIEQAIRELGKLDAVVYAVGIAVLRPVAEMDSQTWRRIFEANVAGASLVLENTLAPLTSSRGRAVIVSSISADDFPPRRGLAGYMVSKAALNKLVEVWQSEHPEVCFTRLSVGDTGGTEFASDWDLEGAGEILQEWLAQRVLYKRMMEPESVGRHVVDLLASEEAVTVSRIVPRDADPPAEEVDSR